MIFADYEHFTDYEKVELLLCKPWSLPINYATKTHLTVNTQNEDSGKFSLWHRFQTAPEGVLQKLHKWSPVRTENPPNLVVQSPCPRPRFLLITIPNGFIMVVLIQS